MKCKLALLGAFVIFVGCDWLTLEPQIEKPLDCGEVRREYVYNHNYTDSVLVDRETICWQAAGGWSRGHKYTPVQDSIPIE